MKQLSISLFSKALTNSLAAAALLISLPVLSQDAISPVDQANARLQERSDATSPNTTTKIVGGVVAPAGKYPFQVALISSAAPEGSEQLGQFCGGSLIDREWVLTAAHCVPNTPSSAVDVYIGSNVLPAGDGVAGDGVRGHVDDIIVHPEYDNATNDNDIALLHLTGPAPMNLKVALVATPGLDTQYNFVNGDAVVIGWGLTAESGNTTPTLRRVWVDIQDSEVCENNYRTVIPSVDITDNMFCAGIAGGGKDSCQGDSGGFIGAPLGGGDYVQLGVVSWGVGCARPDLFGVYTRVGNYTDWIANELASH